MKDKILRERAHIQTHDPSSQNINNIGHDITFSPVGPAGPGGPKGPGRPCQLTEHRRTEGKNAQRSPCLNKHTTTKRNDYFVVPHGCFCK